MITRRRHQLKPPYYYSNMLFLINITASTNVFMSPEATNTYISLLLWPQMIFIRTRGGCECKHARNSREVVFICIFVGQIVGGIKLLIDFLFPMCRCTIKCWSCIRYLNNHPAKSTANKHPPPATTLVVYISLIKHIRYISASNGW